MADWTNGRVGAGRSPCGGRRCPAARRSVPVSLVPAYGSALPSGNRGRRALAGNRTSKYPCRLCTGKMQRSSRETKPPFSWLPEVKTDRASSTLYPMSYRSMAGGCLAIATPEGTFPVGGPMLSKGTPSSRYCQRSSRSANAVPEVRLSCRASLRSATFCRPGFGVQLVSPATRCALCQPRLSAGAPQMSRR